MNRTEADFTCGCQTKLNWQGKECVFVISSCALAVEEGLGHGTLGQSRLFQICSACTVSCIFLIALFGPSSHVCESSKGKV